MVLKLSGDESEVKVNHKLKKGDVVIVCKHWNGNKFNYYVGGRTAVITRGNNPPKVDDAIGYWRDTKETCIISAYSDLYESIVEHTGRLE